MATATYRDQEIVVAAEIHRRHDVGGVEAASNQQRALVDHPVIELPRVFVTSIAALDQRSAQGRSQFGAGFVAHDVLPDRAVASGTHIIVCWRDRPSLRPNGPSVPWLFQAIQLTTASVRERVDSCPVPGHS